MWLFGSWRVGQKSPPTSGISLCVTIGELAVPTKSFDHNVVLKMQSRTLCMLGKHFTKGDPPPHPLLVLSEFLLPLPPKQRLQLCSYLVWSKSGVHMARSIWRLTGHILPCAFHRRILSVLKMSYSFG